MPKIHFEEWPSYTPWDEARRESVLTAAKLMVNAAFTAPVTGGAANLEADIAYGAGEIEEIARKVEELACDNSSPHWQRMCRDEAVMVRESDVVLFLGNILALEYPFDSGCALCSGEPNCDFVYEHHENIFGLVAKAEKYEPYFNGPLCSSRLQNLGYSTGSALWAARELFVDARAYSTVGIVGKKLDYCHNSAMVVGILVSARQKSPYVDIPPYYHLLNMDKVLQSTRKEFAIARSAMSCPYRKWEPEREDKKGGDE